MLIPIRANIIYSTELLIRFGTCKVLVRSLNQLSLIEICRILHALNSAIGFGACKMRRLNRAFSKNQMATFHVNN